MLDRLTRARILAAWHRHRDADGVLWQLPNEHAHRTGLQQLD
ncbi:hypothetical protein [Streptomyces sp. NPDC002547]